MAEKFRAALLLSMPQLQDPNFAKTVVLLCDYGPEGAFGLVLNRPTDMPASTMVRLEPPVTGGNDLPLWLGGPVEFESRRAATRANLNIGINGVADAAPLLRLLGQPDIASRINGQVSWSGSMQRLAAEDPQQNVGWQLSLASKLLSLS